MSGGFFMQIDEWYYGHMRIDSTLKYAAIFGNGMFMLWLVYNAFHEGFAGLTSPQVFSFVALIILLGLDIYLIYRSNR